MVSISLQRRNEYLQLWHAPSQLTVLQNRTYLQEIIRGCNNR
jgi:hypothetical protein